MKRSGLFIFCVIVILTLMGAFQVHAKVRWITYYGTELSQEVIKKIDLAILDPDQIIPDKSVNPSVKYVGYVSVGEAETYRWYWPNVKNHSMVLGKNPNWGGNHYVDVRSPKWQKLLLDQIIPRVLAKGYDGVFLDTIDTAVYLESLDSKKYAGSKHALVSFVKKLRKKYPKIIIIPNNGLEFLMDFATEINGVLVEDVFTRYDFKTKTNNKTPKQETEYKNKFLKEFINKYKKPVYNILYADSKQSSLGVYGIKESKKLGYEWYLTTVDLMKVGTIQD